MNFSKSFAETFEQNTLDVQPATISLMEQCFIDSILEVVTKGVKSNSGPFSIDIGMGKLHVTPDVKKDNTNIHLEFSSEFRKIVNGSDNEIIEIENLDFIETFEKTLDKVDISMGEISGVILGVIFEGLAKTGREHMKEDSWYVLEIPRIGNLKFKYSGETELAFEADKELKQLVKNYGI